MPVTGLTEFTAQHMLQRTKSGRLDLYCVVICLRLHQWQAKLSLQYYTCMESDTYSDADKSTSAKT